MLRQYRTQEGDYGSSGSAIGQEINVLSHMLQ